MGEYIRPVHRLVKLDVSGPTGTAPSHETRVFIGVFQIKRSENFMELSIQAKEVPKVKDIPGIAELLSNPNHFAEDLEAMKTEQTRKE